MNQYKNFFYCCALIGLFSACNKVDLAPQDTSTTTPPTGTTTASPTGTTTTSQVISGNTQFAIDLYQKVVDENKNQMLSPYSISTALAMVYAGANGHTATELQQVLGFGPNNSNFHQTYNQLTNTIESNVNSATNNELNIINKIWRHRTFNFLATFENIMNNDYLAPVEPIDFSQKAAATQQINDWVAQQTHQLIPKLLPDGFITNDTRNILVNAIYFKAAWEHQFATALTASANFTTSNATVTTEMMSMLPTQTLRFVEDTDAEVLELCFEDRQSSILIVLPKDPALGINNFVQQTLSKTRVDQWISNLTYPTLFDLSVKLPKWEFESDFDLVTSLNILGIKEVFTPAANLSKMAESSLSIEKINHKAVIKVDEEGLSAAASTAIRAFPISDPPMTRNFHVNRPFVFMVKDTETNSILFIGHVQDPS